MAEYRETGDNDDYLQQLRQDYSDDDAAWKPIRDEGRTDIRYIAGDAWDEGDKRLRVLANRLCLTFDEFSQYTNQLINDSLQNKRAIKVTANGNGAKDDEAELRANRIRQIEYRSNAQQAYTCAFQNAVEAGFGWIRIKTRFVDHTQNEQEIIIESVPNRDSVTPGPHVKQDASDMKRCWYKEWWTHREFTRKFPDAKRQDFSSHEWADTAPGWLNDKQIMVCEYWEERDGKVSQIFTNGLEVLSRSAWAGKYLPFVPCYGKVLFVSDGGRTDRQIHSLIRLARDPFKAYCYVRTLQAEIIAQMPKFPYFVRRGSLTPEELDNLVRSVTEPVAVIQVEAQLPEMGSAAGPPEFPVRNPYDPTALAALDQTAEAFRRAIQAAIGQSALPTQAQRRNEKSGIALKTIEDSGQRGSFHFVEHKEGMITRAGVVIDDLLGPIHDTARDMTIRKPDDTTQVVRINDPSWVNPDTQQPQELRFSDGDFDVTISVGPQNDSEREAQSDFADLLLQSPEIAQIIGPQNMMKVLAKVIKLKNVGPLGDAIADIIDPPQQDGQVDPQQQAKQMAQAQQAIELMSKQLEGLTRQIQTDAVKMEGQIRLQEMKDATSIRVAEINAAVKGYLLEQQHAAEHEQLALGHAVDVHEGEQDRQHEAAMAAMQHDQGMAAGDAEHRQALEQGDQAHQQQLEQGAMGHEQALEQQAAAPQPEAGA